MTLPTGGYKSLRVTTPGYTNKYLRHQDSLAFTEVVDGNSSALLKNDATWKIVPPGLANGNCYSFESRNYPPASTCATGTSGSAARRTTARRSTRPTPPGARSPATAVYG